MSKYSQLTFNVIPDISVNKTFQWVMPVFGIWQKTVLYLSDDITSSLMLSLLWWRPEKNNIQNMFAEMRKVVVFLRKMFQGFTKILRMTNHLFLGTLRMRIGFYGNLISLHWLIMHPRDVLNPLKSNLSNIQIRKMSSPSPSFMQLSRILARRSSILSLILSINLSSSDDRTVLIRTGSR